MSERFLTEEELAAACHEPDESTKVCFHNPLSVYFAKIDEPLVVWLETTMN